MAFEVGHLTDAVAALEISERFLCSSPVEHNLILTLLSQRASEPAAGNYWIVREEGDVCGVVFSSPSNYPATMSQMPMECVSSVVDAVAAVRTDLPGISGEPGLAARFAGCWTETLKGVSAIPDHGLRIYEVDQLLPISAHGEFRWADESDRSLLVDWFTSFHEELAQPDQDIEGLVDFHLSGIGIWTDGVPVSMALVNDAVASTQRIGGVFTPLSHRRRGYAGACVSALTQHVLASGNRAMLYTDLGNPTSNSIYRRMGYVCKSEAIQYLFRM